MIYLSNIVKSPEDIRDYKFSSTIPAQSLPRKVDLRQFAGGIEDQQTIGSCTANATCSALELMAQRAGKFEDLSRLFMYYETRLMENRIGQDGAVLRDALKAANKVGVPAEVKWPYDISKVDIKPTVEAYEDALQRMLTSYEAIPLAIGLNTKLGYWDGINNLKAALAEGLPVALAMAVYDPILHLKGPLSEQRYSARDEATMQPYKSIGNHAVVLVGYDDDLGIFFYENSWGKQWGDNGYGAIRYGVIGGVAFEAWVVRGFHGIEIVKPIPIPEPTPEPIPVVPDPTPTPDPVAPPEPQPTPEPVVPPAPPIPIPEEQHDSGSKGVLIASVLIALAVVAKLNGLW